MENAQLTNINISAGEYLESWPRFPAVMSSSNDLGNVNIQFYISAEFEVTNGQRSVAVLRDPRPYEARGHS